VVSKMMSLSVMVLPLSWGVLQAAREFVLQNGNGPLLALGGPLIGTGKKKTISAPAGLLAGLAQSSY
jgi:hypothetical protein